MPRASKTSKSNSQTKTTGAEVVYVYCAVDGTVDAATLARLPAMPGGGSPRVIPLTEAISLMVASLPAAQYSAEAIEPHLADINWVGARGSAHHGVIDELAATHAVVPFRIFTLFSSEARARAAMQGLATKIDAAMTRVRGKVEWVLRIARPDATRRAQVAAASPDAGSTAPTSGADFLARKAAAKRAVVDAATRVRDDTVTVFDTLSAIADESNHRSVEQTGLLLDAAFLVERAKEDDFKRALERTAQGLLNEGCRVSLTGPWPAYSFVSLEAGS